MKDENVIKKLNTEIEEIYSTHVYYTIDDGNPLMSYYRAVSINAIEEITLDESEIQSLARKICHIVINKGRKTFFQNKNNQKYYDSVKIYHCKECGRTLLTIKEGTKDEFPMKELKAFAVEGAREKPFN